MAEFEFEDIKNRAAKAVGRTGCTTSNIIVLDEGGFRGWRSEGSVPVARR